MKPTHIGLQAGALLLLLSTFSAGAFQATVPTEVSTHSSQAGARNGVDLADFVVRVVGETVPQDQMTEFCRNVAAKEMRVDLEDLSTLDPIVRSNEILVEGSWDSPDDDRMTPFECRFGLDGVFQNFYR
jgi:hypothetical protein